MSMWTRLFADWIGIRDGSQPFGSTSSDAVDRHAGMQRCCTLCELNHHVHAQFQHMMWTD